MRDYTIHIPTYIDAQEIQDLLYPGYFDESVYNTLDYDETATLNYILNWIGEHTFIARDNGGKVVGVMAFYFANTFYKQKECDLVMLYIHPDFRGSGLSRDFVQILDGVCREIGNVGVAYTTSGSGMEGNNDALYKNLFKKFGFEVLGTELIKVFK